MTSNEPLEERFLFGGAMQLSCPTRLLDVSDFRPIPDNQEVLADADTDDSLIVEIVEHCEAASALAHPAEFFFRNIAEEGEAVSSDLLASSLLDDEAIPQLQLPASIATGNMLIAKGRQPGEAANLVQVVVAAVQLERVKSDIVISLNTPLIISEQSASAQHAGAGGRSSVQAAASQHLLKRILATFKIVDWTVFGEEEQ